MAPAAAALLPSALEIVRTRSLSSLVAEEIERMILSGELPAGGRINEQALAAQLKVSRGPVREAVRGLERSGLVVAVVNQGSYVRRVSAAEALDLFDLRALLLGYACARLVDAATSAQVDALRGQVARMAVAHRADDAAGYYALNVAFHAALLEQAGNPRARRIDEDLGNELHLFRRRALVQPENMHESNAEHARIVAAIASRDAEAARAAGEAHIRSGKRRFALSHAGATGASPLDEGRPREAASFDEGPRDAAEGGEHARSSSGPAPPGDRRPPRRAAARRRGGGG